MDESIAPPQPIETTVNEFTVDGIEFMPFPAEQPRKSGASTPESHRASRFTDITASKSRQSSKSPPRSGRSLSPSRALRMFDEQKRSTVTFASTSEDEKKAKREVDGGEYERTNSMNSMLSASSPKSPSSSGRRPSSRLGIRSVTPSSERRSRLTDSSNCYSLPSELDAAIVDSDDERGVLVKVPPLFFPSAPPPVSLLSRMESASHPNANKHDERNSAELCFETDFRAFMIDFEELDLEAEPFASGGGGSIYRGEYNGSLVAAKTVHHPQDAAQQAEFDRETLMLAGLHHPNIVRFYGISINPETDTMFLVEEFAENGDLLDLIKEPSESLAPQTFIRVVMDLLGGLYYMHSLNIAHTDLKPQNVLLDRDGRVKIVDLGNARKGKQIEAGVGTAAYMPPEAFDETIVFEESYTGAAWDVFSLGVILWQLYYQDAEPWKGLSAHAIVARLRRKKRPKFEAPEPPPPLKSLIEACWAHEHIDRPTIKTIRTLFEQQVVPVIRRLSALHDWEDYAKALENGTVHKFNSDNAILNSTSPERSCALSTTPPGSARSAGSLGGRTPGMERFGSFQKNAVSLALLRERVDARRKVDESRRMPSPRRSQSAFKAPRSAMVDGVDYSKQPRRNRGGGHQRHKSVGDSPMQQSSP